MLRRRHRPEARLERCVYLRSGETGAGRVVECCWCGGVWVGVCACVRRASACECVRVRASACECVRECVCARARAPVRISGVRVRAFGSERSRARASVSVRTRHEWKTGCTCHGTKSWVTL